MLKKFHYHDVDYRGTIERVSYTAHYPGGEEKEKYANVYLPCGYDPADADKKYDILYLMHGGGGNPDAWLDACWIKNMLDCCFHEKEAAPCIVVFPGYYHGRADRVDLSQMEKERQLVSDFAAETVKELLPAVEGRVRGWAESFDEAGLSAARGHRAFGGFSMGSVTTWFQFQKNLAYFSVFLPLSGDSWAIERLGGDTQPVKTVDVLQRAAEEGLEKGFDFRIFAATGSEDMACANMAPQMAEMKRRPLFAFSDDPAAGRLHYEVAPGAVHSYEDVYQYVYSYLPYLFGE